MIHLYMSVVTTLFEVGGNMIPPIGGAIQTFAISAPPNSVYRP